jgi:hypothetical protein
MTGSHRTLEAISYFDELTSRDMDTIKEILNIARRVANSVDSSTATFEPDVSATREVRYAARFLSPLPLCVCRVPCRVGRSRSAISPRCLTEKQLYDRFKPACYAHHDTHRRTRTPSLPNRIAHPLTRMHAKAHPRSTKRTAPPPSSS